MAGDVRCYSLTSSDSLSVRISDDVLPLVQRWIPLHAQIGDRPNNSRATIHVTANALSLPSLRATPLLSLGGVIASVRDADHIVFRTGGSNGGVLDLSAPRADIALPDATSPAASHDAFSMLTLASAFLLGRLEGALMHAGAVVDPHGHAWLLVGDSHAGKSTTTVSLVSAGWSYLADDQVVLSRSTDGTLMVDGWPRIAHLDAGWHDGTIAGTRVEIDLRKRWGKQWRPSAPLGGVLMTVVNAPLPTLATAVHPASTFAALVRQSPWLMGDVKAAPGTMALLQRAASLPGFILRLGKDSYARGDVLAERLLVLGMG